MMLAKTAVAVSLLLTLATPLTLAGQENGAHGLKPAAVSGIVPDGEAAIAIALAAWMLVYGTERIEKEKPYRAFLRDGVWFVSGTLAKGYAGGVAEAEIAKQDGRVLKIRHGK